jgi:DNA polymerase-1
MSAEHGGEQRAGPVLLLDAFSLFFRAFYALPAMNTSRGEPTSAVYGLSVLLLKLIREQRPVGLAFALDVGRTFRHAGYQEYKATRGGAPSALGAQMPRLTELLRVLDVPAFGSPGFEADDVLATLSRELAGRDQAPMVITGDHDCLQLARGAARVMIVSRGTAKAEIYDELAIRMRFGLRPDQLPEYRALVGDPSDNIPGVPGIGPRTASALIGRFGDVATLLARLDEVTPPRIREAIQAVADKLPLYADISRLRDEVPLPPEPHWRPIDAAARERLRAFFEELEFKSLLPRIDASFAEAPPG